MATSNFPEDAAATLLQDLQYRIKINIQKEKQTNKKKEEKSEKALNMTFAVHLMSAVGSTWWPDV